MRVGPPRKRTLGVAGLLLAAAIGGFLLSGLGSVARGTIFSSSTKPPHGGTPGGNTTTGGLECPAGEARDNTGKCVSTTTETAPPPDLEIVKEGPATAEVGGVMVFHLFVGATNTDLPVGAVVTVTELVPAGTTLRGAVGTGWACAPPPPSTGPRTITCTYKVAAAAVPALPTLTVSLGADRAGHIENCARVAGTLNGLPVDDPPANNRSCVSIVISGPAPTSTIGGSAPLPPPKPSVSVNVTSGPGTTLVRLPGRTTFAILRGRAQIPVGSEIDVTGGSVGLMSAEGTAQFSKGSFLIREPRAPVTVRVTDLVLTRGDFSACPLFVRKPASVSQAKKPVRRLWGRGKGRFRTTGKYAAATVRGTSWRITDRCDGTLTEVLVGRVAVFDIALRRTVIVTAGHSYFAPR